MIPEVVLFSMFQPIPSTIFAFRDILTGAADVFGGIILFIIGILVIALVVAAAIVLLPAIVVAVLIWFLTGSVFYAGIAFLVVALLSIIAVADD